jgi:hypothetical protein
MYLGEVDFIQQPAPSEIPNNIRGNSAFIDGNGVSPFGRPGIGVIEPNAPNMLNDPDTDPDGGENLDPLDLGTTFYNLANPIFLSLYSGIIDPLETDSLPPNTGTAAGNGFVGGDVLVQPSRSSSLFLFADVFAHLGLGRWADGDPFSENTNTDDLDALILWDDMALDDNGNPFFNPETDKLYFSVCRNSTVIGELDSLFNWQIEEGDILAPPDTLGLSPKIFIPAEALGLATVRSIDFFSTYGIPNPQWDWLDMWADELDALDIISILRPDPGDENTKFLTIEDALLAQHGVKPAQTPEPSSLTLVFMGFAWTIFHCRRRRLLC